MYFRQLIENKDKTNSSGKKDDLNMWRLYGGNARGICMVFSFNSQQNSVLKKIQYMGHRTKRFFQWLGKMGKRF